MPAVPSPRWVWSKAGWTTDRPPSAVDVIASVHPDVARLRAALPPYPEQWPAWYPHVNALVEREGDGFRISFYDTDLVMALCDFIAAARVRCPPSPPEEDRE